MNPRSRVNDGGNEDIWIHDLARGTSSRLTFGPTDEVAPIWTPDGERVVFNSTGEPPGLYWKAADGTGQVEPLFTGDSRIFPDAISPDGAWLVFEQQNEGRAWDLHLLSLQGERAVQPLLELEGNQEFSVISPDGRWIAYGSSETGRNEIFVGPFPNIEQGKWQISTDGGSDPVWAPDGGELFFRSPESVLIAVSIDTEPTFSAGIPTALFSTAAYADQPLSYAVSADGQRFLMMKSAGGDSAGDAERPQFIIVENWFEELRRLAPVN